MSFSCASSDSNECRAVCNHHIVYWNGLGRQLGGAEQVPKEELVSGLELVTKENMPQEAITSS